MASQTEMEAVYGLHIGAVYRLCYSYLGSAAKAEDAAKDLERVEQQVVAEATMSTEYDDALGNEQAAAEDAETAFEFEQAEIAAEQSL